MISLICFMMLITGMNACMKTVPGDPDGPGPDKPACDNCAAASQLTCPQSNICDFSLLTKSTNGESCSAYSCSKGQMYAYVNLKSTEVEGAVCDRENQLVWKSTTGETYGQTLQATCAFPCATCTSLTTVTTPCPVNYDCSNTGIEEPLTYSMDSRGCTSVKCTVGQMFSSGQTVQEGICTDGAFVVAGAPITQAACGLPCNACTPLTKNGLTCPTGHTCTTVSQRAGQCPEAYCPSGMMTADGVHVASLKCNTQGQWVDTAGTVYTAAQCELSCELCTALTNAGMPCPTGLICEPPTEREGTCKETYCPEGDMTGNPTRTALTSLTCSGGSEWVDGLDVVYTSAQCETRCDECAELTSNGMTCPTGFVCEDVTLQAGQCPSVTCTEGTMKANPGSVEVTSLTCDGSAQWVDDQNAVYTAAQCEAPCTECTALTNTGMDCPKGLICEVAMQREGQCSELFCATGSLTGNTERTPLTLLTCNTEAEWVDTQDVTYTLAQCETPCDQCAALTNTGMTCLSGFICTPVTTNTDGQCPEATCVSGLMTAGDGRTTVTSLSCNGLTQWVDAQDTVYTKAQCETGCTCPPLTISTPPTNQPPPRGNPLGADAQGCSILTPQCRQMDLYRLVTDNGIVTLQPPAARNTAMTCRNGKWMATINGVETVVTEQACYSDYTCLYCGNVNAGSGVVVTLTYNPTTWCKQYTLSGCTNGYRIGMRTITSPLTCDRFLRWTSGSYNSNALQSVTVNCA